MTNTTLHGVLSPHPVSGGGAPKRDWSVDISMLAYKLDGGEIVREKLSARKVIDRADMDDWFARFRNLSTITMNGQLREYANASGRFYFDMNDETGSSNDADIVQLADELAQAVTREDTILGLLTLNRHFDEFSGRAKFNGATVWTGVAAEGDDFAEGALDAVHGFFRNAADWDVRLRRFAAMQLLDLKNDTWSSEDDAPVSDTAFLSSLTPVSVHIEPDGHFSVDYSAEDMFLGHNIMVTGTLDGGPTRAHL